MCFTLESLLLASEATVDRCTVNRFLLFLFSSCSWVSICCRRSRCFNFTATACASKSLLGSPVGLLQCHKDARKVFTFYTSNLILYTFQTCDTPGFFAICFVLLNLVQFREKLRKSLFEEHQVDFFLNQDTAIVRVRTGSNAEVSWIIVMSVCKKKQIEFYGWTLFSLQGTKSVIFKEK